MNNFLFNSPRWRSENKKKINTIRFWINQHYLNRPALTAIRDAYLKNKTIQSVQLRDFLNKRAYTFLQRDAWGATRKRQSSSTMFIYDALKPHRTMLDFERLLRSKEFAALLSFLAGKKLAVQEIEWQSFSHRHYTLLHDKRVQKNGVYFFLDLPQQWDDAWGGYTSLVRDGQELIRISPRGNAATFLTMAGKARQFTKYVNYRAGKHRRIVLVARFK